MSPAHIDAVVRLEEEVPSLGLRRGAEGVVTSVWLSPGGLLCEVEFPSADASSVVRALVRADQLKAVSP